MPAIKEETRTVLLGCLYGTHYALKNMRCVRGGASYYQRNAYLGTAFDHLRFRYLHLV